MCLILDTNRHGDFLNPFNADMKPVKKWVDKKGKIAYSPTKDLEKELTNKKLKEQFAIYRQLGKMKIVPKEEVQEVQNKLQGLKSDDPHIMALAIVANVRLLVTGDKKLCKDFEERIDGGEVYQSKAQKKILKNYSCP